MEKHSKFQLFYAVTFFVSGVVFSVQDNYIIAAINFLAFFLSSLSES
jgi:hypothetical protein